MRVGDNGFFTAEDDTYVDAGRIGIFSASDSLIRNVTVEGDEEASDWVDDVCRPANGFHPCPDTVQGVVQQVNELLRLPSGELLLTFKAGDGISQGTICETRSSDDGLTWSKPEILNIPFQGGRWTPAHLHVTPGGRLIYLVPTEDGFATAESFDGGLTWSDPVPVEIGPKPPKSKSFVIQPQAFLNLQDGSMLLFACGGHSLSDPDLNVGNWGPSIARHSRCTQWMMDAHGRRP